MALVISEDRISVTDLLTTGTLVSTPIVEIASAGYVLASSGRWVISPALPFAPQQHSSAPHPPLQLQPSAQQSRQPVVLPDVPSVVCASAGEIGRAQRRGGLTVERRCLCRDDADDTPAYFGFITHQHFGAMAVGFVCHVFACDNDHTVSSLPCQGIDQRECAGGGWVCRD